MPDVRLEQGRAHIHNDVFVPNIPKWVALVTIPKRIPAQIDLGLLEDFFKGLLPYHAAVALICFLNPGGTGPLKVSLLGEASYA